MPSEDVIEQYQLRSTFIAGRLQRDGYLGLLDRARVFVGTIHHTLDWENSGQIGIEAGLSERLGIPSPEMGILFCHPSTIVADPSLLKYFRCISVYPYKGLATVTGISSGTIQLFETGRTPTAAQARTLATAINTNLSLIYEHGAPDEEKIKGLMYAQAGSTLDGSWRNQIGREGERTIRRLLLRYLIEQEEITALFNFQGDLIPLDNPLEDSIDNIKSAWMTNGSQLVFGSEPDIKIIDASSKTTGGVEIKAGLDPAGALERLGAIYKSFEAILAEETSAETILVISTLTDEMQRRVNSAGIIKRTFIFGEVARNVSNRRTAFCNQIRSLLRLA